LTLWWWKSVRLACLVNRTAVEVEGWFHSRDFRTVLLLVRVVGYKVDENLNPRPGGATWGKWRILDGMGESGLMSDLEL
jgi:hypothetical protein